MPLLAFLGGEPGHRFNPVKAAHIHWARIVAIASDLYEAYRCRWKGVVWLKHTAFVRKGHQVTGFDACDGCEYKESEIIDPAVWNVFVHHSVWFAAMGVEVHTGAEREIFGKT
jgi:hypothetical protein